MHLAMLSNDEVLRIARAEINDLTSTALEVELLKRLEALLDDSAEPAAVYDAAANYGLDADGVRKLGEAVILNASNTAELLTAIGEAGFDSPAEIKREFELAQKVRALANDAGDVFSRLSSLTETATA